MKTFNTHVFAVVRVKVLGTTFSEIKEIANRVADAVFTWPHAWHTSAPGDLLISDAEYRIEHTEVAWIPLSSVDPLRIMQGSSNSLVG